MRRMFVLLLTAGVLTGCSVGQDLPAANAGVVAFHQKLNALDFAGIYAATSPEFKTVSSQADFTQLLAAIHTKLGAFQSGVTRTWNDNATTNGHFVTLTYAAKYDRGGADEQFVYRIEGASATLAGYHISSNALIVN